MNTIVKTLFDWSGGLIVRWRRRRFGRYASAVKACRDGKLTTMNKKLNDGPDYDLDSEEAWAAEVERRQSEIESGAVALLSGPETLRRLKAEFQ